MAQQNNMTLKSDLPFGSEFSPSQIHLPTLLNLIVAHQSNNQVLQNAIQDHFFASHGGGNPNNQQKLAMNCRLGLKAYGIIDENANFTTFGQELLTQKDDENKLYEALAQHILLNLKGMALIQCIRDMVAAGEQINLTSLRAGLKVRNIHYPPGGKHPSIMRLWLAKAGIFIDHGWQINELRLTQLLPNPNEFANLSRFTPEQRAFLMALANAGISTPQPANEIVKLATATYGTKFPEKSLPKLILNPLVEAGYITATKTTTGRGAKPFLVTPTNKLTAEIITPLLNQLTNLAEPKLLDLLRQPLDKILQELDSPNRHISGLALEALGFKLMQLLDMTYVATRLRAQATGGAEVDLIFESARLIFSRWQIQCKNSAYVSLDDVAKEVGLTHFLKSNAIIIISTGKISAEARRYANKIMSDSNLCIVMLDGTDLKSLRQNPIDIVDFLHREATHTMSLKKLVL